MLRNKKFESELGRENFVYPFSRYWPAKRAPLFGRGVNCKDRRLRGYEQLEMK